MADPAFATPARFTGGITGSLFRRFAACLLLGTENALHKLDHVSEPERLTDKGKSVAPSRDPYGLIRDTGAMLLDMTPDRKVTQGIRQAVEANGDPLADLHLWRLGRGIWGQLFQS